MLGYVTFGSNDKEASQKFFEAVLAPLGYKTFYNDVWVGLAKDGDPSQPGTVWMGTPYDGKTAVASNGMMVGFQAPTRQSVRDFHAAALAHGGSCEGEPGLREAYGPNIYMAYVRDPVGNKMSAMCTKDSE